MACLGKVKHHLLPFCLVSIANAIPIDPKVEVAIDIGHTSQAGRVGLLWTSIVLAIITSFLQGLAVTVVTITEDQDMWTFRFRIAKYEHIWWTVISTLLFASFIFVIFSFLSGNNNDALGILALSTATSIAIVRYAIPAWRNRHYVQCRWLAWTGPSRTAIPASFGNAAGDASWWENISRSLPSKPTTLLFPSDTWGWAINPPGGIAEDPTALLNYLPRESEEGKQLPLGRSVYDDGYHSGSTVSLLWGQHIGFRPRVSRGINSMPRALLNSRPFTDKGYKGDGLCLALGILGRNKGLRPFQLVFDHKDARKNQRGISRESIIVITTHLENTSTWSPRPNKVMRSFYDAQMRDQFEALGEEYVGAAIELALIFLDCPPKAIEKWLSLQLEQQSIDVNKIMSAGPAPTATAEQLQTLYRASYTCMILSLNHFPPEKYTGDILRPELICFALLWLAEGSIKEVPLNDNAKEIHITAAAPQWWTQPWVGERLRKEMESLSHAGTQWKSGAAWLLGLPKWPAHLDRWPAWESLVCQP